ncbi:MAG TPA: AMP-binding protein [Bdellovibrionota bacterium]|nr:AMP-binding protein [Bdellovibrionota bacterium]
MTTIAATDPFVSFLRKSPGLRNPDAPAICAPGEAPLSFTMLMTQVESVAATLERIGIGPGDKVAMMVQEGACAATAFLSVASAAVAAPLNPAYRAEEIAFYLDDMGARALIVDARLDTAAREVARERNIAVLELEPTLAGAGLFHLRVADVRGQARAGRKSDPDTCLVLHTSGTTARPKLVPLTAASLWASAGNIARTLELSPADRCFNVMPLFHIHGLVACLLATLGSGGSLVCSPGPRFPDFLDWLREFQPTWYSAVPTIHQAILSGIESSSASPPSGLRLIRSSSSALPPTLMEELKRVFRVPVIEAYGMTEASHQMASNPLPPARQKPGSVGLAAGPEVSILGEDGRLLEAGRKGEIVIRGPTVTRGYESNSESNQAAFQDGWFRTGDLGFMDADGYLFLVGRIKEIINRGGEKVSPREVDEALLEHPGVSQAVAFGMPHPTLGEEVAAAVVARSGQVLEEAALQDFARGRLSEFKVPKRILIVAEIPKGPTGKVQRAVVFQRLQERLDASSVRPRDELEERIAAIWRRVLKREDIGIHDNFFAAGGDSLQALAVIAEAQKSGILIDPVLSIRTPTIAGLASLAKAGSTQAEERAEVSGESWYRRLMREL